MPVVRIQIMRDVTATVQRVPGKKPEHTHFVMREVAEKDWGFAGQLTDDWRHGQAAG